MIKTCSTVHLYAFLSRFPLFTHVMIQSWYNHTIRFHFSSSLLSSWHAQTRILSFLNQIHPFSVFLSSISFILHTHFDCFSFLLFLSFSLAYSTRLSRSNHWVFFTVSSFLLPHRSTHFMLRSSLSQTSSCHLSFSHTASSRSHVLNQERSLRSVDLLHFRSAFYAPDFIWTQHPINLRFIHRRTCLCVHSSPLEL